MCGVFVVACLQILGSAASALVHPEPDQTGVVKQEDGKPIAESHVGEIYASTASLVKSLYLDLVSPAAHPSDVPWEDSITRHMHTLISDHVREYQSGVRFQQRLKIYQARSGHISAEKSGSKPAVESHVGVSSPEKSENAKGSTAVSSSAAADPDASQISFAESLLAAANAEASRISTESSSAEANADASKISIAESLSAEANADPSKIFIAESSSAEGIADPFGLPSVISSKPTSDSSVEFGRNHPEDPHEDRTIMDKIHLARSDEANDSGSPMFQFLFLACGGWLAVAWVYSSKHLRNWQHDIDWQVNSEKKFAKPSSTAMHMHSMLEPMVQDARAVIGEAVKAADKVQKNAWKAAETAQSSYQSKADDDDLLTLES